MILSIFKVTEHSLTPVYQDGDFVVISKIPILFRGPRPGDVVVFQLPYRDKMIKIVERVEGNGDSVWVVGSHPDSIDSRAFGAVPINCILGKVIWHIHRM